jgi:hypothetical protein
MIQYRDYELLHAFLARESEDYRWENYNNRKWNILYFMVMLN